MFDLIRKIWQTKTVTKKFLFTDAPPRYRGKPIFAANECTGCKDCVTFCPSGAIEFQQTGDSIELSISYVNCIFCGICAEKCETKMIQATNEYRLATKNKTDLFTTANAAVKATDLLPAGKEG